MSLMPETRLHQEQQQMSALVIGQSPAARRMLAFMEAVAPTEHTVLLNGETGSGKDRMARKIHDLGPGRKKFIMVNCGQMPESLIETELFGHTGNAFTGAEKSKPGLVLEAEDGTLFLNEVVNLSFRLQTKLLDIFDKKPFRALGSVKENEVRTRIIVATNANLEEAVERKELREDLYFRIRAITFMVPPLRERKDDIPLFVEHFLRQEKDARRFSPRAEEIIMDYHWPGNVRELESVVTGANLLARLDNEESILAHHVEPHLTYGRREVARTTEKAEAKEGFPTLRENEKDYLIRVLEKTRGNVSKAAALAGVKRNAIYTRIRRCQLDGLTSSMKQSP